MKHSRHRRFRPGPPLTRPPSASHGENRFALPPPSSLAGPSSSSSLAGPSSSTPSLASPSFASPPPAGPSPGPLALAPLAAPPPPPPSDALPAPPPPRPSSSSAPLPRSLTALGNERAWKAVAEHLRRRIHLPLVVHGPTGCGKSKGVSVLLDALQLRPVFLDGADGEGNDQLLSWIRRTREVRTNTEGGRSVVVLDDLESFSEPMRKEIDAYLRTSRASRKLGGLVITLTNRRDPALSAVAECDEVRLFAPRERELRGWFREHAPWLDRGGEGRRGFPDGAIDRVADLLPAGDLRRIGIALGLAARTGRRGDAERERDRTERDATGAFSNAFEALRLLLLARPETGVWRRWAHHAEERDMDLLREHLPAHAPDLSRLADGADALSLAASCAPDRFEARGGHLGMRLAIAGLAGQRSSLTREVGALRPPPRRCTPSTAHPKRSRGSGWLDLLPGQGGVSLPRA